MIPQNPLPPEFLAELTRLFPEPVLRKLGPALDTPSPVSVRLNRRKACDALPFPDAERVPWCPDGLYLAERPLFTLMPEMHGGAFYVQEAASMIYGLIGSRIIGKEPVRVLDLCAAPGGKTTALLNVLPEGSVAVANEQSPQRAAVLAENLTKYGYPGVAVTCGDAREYGVMEGMFDILAVDAPCSGEGMMRKEEVARTQWSPGLVESCARLQMEILDRALPALRPGGWLIYSTCTFNLRENEEISRRLTEEWGLIPVNPISDREAAEWGVHPPLGHPDGTPGHGMRFLPGRTRSEGLYAALFRKGEEESGIMGATSPSSPKTASKKRKEMRGNGAPVPDLSVCRKWVVAPEEYVWETTAAGLRAVPRGLSPLLDHLPGSVRLLSAGTEVATVKGRDVMPAPPLALSSLLADGAFPEVELDRETALRYLRRESLNLPPDTPKGPVIVSFNGVRLGWVKNLGNRANNLWPAPWRIRMQ